MTRVRSEFPKAKLDRLRKNLTNDQRQIIDAIWQHAREHNEWLRTRVLHGRMRKTFVRTSLQSLGGTVVFTDGYGSDERYKLTFLGALLSGQGIKGELLLTRYLEYIKAQYLARPETERVSSSELQSALRLTADELGLLRELIMISHFWGGGGGNVENWEAILPSDIDELAEVQDLSTYVHSKAMESFAPDTPVDRDERTRHWLSQQHQGGGQGHDVPRDDTYKKMFETVVLEREQEELLATLVEAARNVPRDRRQEFYLTRTFDGDTIIHQGLPGDHNMKCYFGDVHTLANARLLNLISERDHGDLQFDITPLGYKYYQYERQRSGQPIQQIETEVRSYLDGQLFRQRYPRSYEKWCVAERALWSGESQRQLTTIGHLCREAMQEFASELVEQGQSATEGPDKQKTVARIRAILDQERDKLGKTEGPFLDALLAYWGTLSDLVQRQEHGAQKEGQRLVWEDARRVVFQTAMVMFEIDRSLGR